MNASLDLGLDVTRLVGDDGPVIEVHSARPARRVGPTGDVLADVIIQVTQRRPGYLDAQVQEQVDQQILSKKPDALTSAPTPDFWFRGGGTLVVDLEHGTVRYAVVKNIWSGSAWPGSALSSAGAPTTRCARCTSAAGRKRCASPSHSCTGWECAVGTRLGKEPDMNDNTSSPLSFALHHRCQRRHLRSGSGRPQAGSRFACTARAWATASCSRSQRPSGPELLRADRLRRAAGRAERGRQSERRGAGYSGGDRRPDPPVGGHPPPRRSHLGVPAGTQRLRRDDHPQPVAQLGREPHGSDGSGAVAQFKPGLDSTAPGGAGPARGARPGGRRPGFHRGPRRDRRRSDCSRCAAYSQAEDRRSIAGRAKAPYHCLVPRMAPRRKARASTCWGRLRVCKRWARWIRARAPTRPISQADCRTKCSRSELAALDPKVDDLTDDERMAQRAHLSISSCLANSA